MSLALRYGACGSFFLATILLGASLFLPVEHIDSQPPYNSSANVGAWAVDGGLPAANGTVTKAGTWYDSAFSGASGSSLLMLRLAGPLLIVGLLVVLTCGFMVLSGRGIATGWTGTAGLLIAGLGMLCLLLGVNAFAKSITPINTVLDNGIRPDIGFWSMFIGLLLGSGAALASFSVKLEPKGRIGPDGEPLPPLPILSVENPTAFNPMANRDPRPFRAEEQEYKSFEVTGGRKTFKSKPEGEKEEEAWEEPEAAPPATPPTPPRSATATPAKPAAPASAPPAKPAAAAKPKA